MTAVVVPPLPLPDMAPSVAVTSSLTQSDARKRRREILSSQRVTSSSSSTASTESSIEADTRKRKQMKYDPDVPMSKEDAAAWRREQRRKRNRESAAASRQRQRDRIQQLESEVDEWKLKYDSILAKIRLLEEKTGLKVDLEQPSQDQPTRSESPILSAISTVITPRASPVTSSFADKCYADVSDSEGELDVQQPPKMISRHAESRIIQVSSGHRLRLIHTESGSRMTSKITIPAVKIDPDAALPLMPDEPLITPPDACLSNAIEPIDSTLFSSLESDQVLADADGLGEFGDFLLDAVDWL